MTDNIGKEPLARKAGRGLMRALRGLFGDRIVRKTRDSARALAEEYRRGKEEAEVPGEPPPRSVPHRVIPDEAPRPGGAAPEESPAPE